MNSIIWKGVSSTTIQGLLICELPPITKPEMRIAETVIDGRDGSIIEELGYSSYVKTVTIGLHGNFDINKVIKYFTGEGDIVFSNEPDKVYKAKICGKIDYTRLLRYRQASIPFMVQPFKYKLNEYLREAQTATASGTSIVVNDSADAKLKAFKIFGKSTQDGTPTPEAPIDIVSLCEDGNISVFVKGKNLLQNTRSEIGQSYVNNGVTFTRNTDGSITMNGTATENAFCGIDYYNGEVKYPTQTPLIASVSGLVDGVAMYIGYFTYEDALVDSVAVVRPTTTSVEYELPLSAKQGRTYLAVSKGVTLNNVVVYPMIIMKNATNAFEPSKTAQSLSIKTPNEMRAIPVTDKSLATYTDASGQMWCADEIDIEKGLHITRVRKITLTGTENLFDAPLVTNAGYYRYRMDLGSKYITDISNDKMYDGYCSHYSRVSAGAGYNGKGLNKTAMQTENLSFYVDFATVDAFKAFLAEQYAQGTPVEVVYRLATSIETALSEEQNAIAEFLKSNEPTTTISNDENAYMSVEYFKPFEVFNEGLEESKPLMILKGNGTVEISVNGVGIFSYTFPDGENEVYIDSETEDAYLGDVLKNRNMNGEFPILIPKTNKIEWSGDIESISILPRSRWL